MTGRYVVALTLYGSNVPLHQQPLFLVHRKVYHPHALIAVFTVRHQATALSRLHRRRLQIYHKGVDSTSMFPSPDEFGSFKLVVKSGACRLHEA